MGYYNELSMTPDSRPFSDEGWSIDERRTPALPPPTPAVTDAPAEITYCVEYSRDDHGYSCTIIFEDGKKEYIGSAHSYDAGTSKCRVYIYDYYRDNHTPEKAIEVLHTLEVMDGVARDMGGMWEITPRDKEWTYDGEPMPLPSPPHTWTTHTGRTRTEHYPVEPAVMVEPPAPPVDDGPEDNFGGFRQPITMEDAVNLAYAMRHVPLADEERWAHRTQPACSCGSTCPCCGPSHPEAPERGWERAEIDIPSMPACEQCCAGPATWEVREKSGLCHICDTCYRNEFEENPDRHWTAWEADRLSTPIDPPPPTRIIRAECAICHDRAGCKEREEQRYCRNCRGLHHIQRCPEIHTLLMPGPLPAQTCPSCGDPSPCAACREVGEMRTKLRETVQSLPALTKETLKVYRDGPSWAL